MSNLLLLLLLLLLTINRLYVTRFGTLSETQTTGSVEIGTGEIVTSGTTQFTDQQLNGNTDYYIFIRVFSSLLDKSVSSGSR